MKIVCLCGSIRFWRQFQISSLEESIQGNIILSIGSASGTDDDHFGNLPSWEKDKIVDRLNELHLRKIDISDEILVLNVYGYIGEHTRNEMDYALEKRKTIRFLNLPSSEDYMKYIEKNDQL